MRATSLLKGVRLFFHPCMCVGATAMQKTNHSAAVKDKRWAMEAL